MLMLALLIGQALGPPEVEEPIPGQIGLGDLVSLAGAGGVLGAVLSFARPRSLAVGPWVGNQERKA